MVYSPAAERPLSKQITAARLGRRNWSSCLSPVVALHRLKGEYVLVCVQVLRKAGIDVAAEVGFGEYDPDSRERLVAPNTHSAPPAAAQTGKSIAGSDKRAGGPLFDHLIGAN